MEQKAIVHSQKCYAPCYQYIMTFIPILVPILVLSRITFEANYQPNLNLIQSLKKKKKDQNLSISNY